MKPQQGSPARGISDNERLPHFFALCALHLHRHLHTNSFFSATCGIFTKITGVGTPATSELALVSGKV
jgi:hypothetical protein